MKTHSRKTDRGLTLPALSRAIIALTLILGVVAPALAICGNMILVAWGPILGGGILIGGLVCVASLLLLLLPQSPMRSAGTRSDISVSTRQEQRRTTRTSTS